MEKEIKINVPDGYEIDREKSTFENIVLKKKEDGLPMRWEDLEAVHGWYVGSCCGISNYCDYPSMSNRNTWPSKEEAMAALALSQLLQLRNAWNGDFRKDWDDNISVWTIYQIGDHINIDDYAHIARSLYFKTEELAEKFLDTFRDLIETAKPLL